MQKTMITLKECQVGHVLAKPVFNKQGASVVLENTCVTEYIKARLEEMQNEHIWIYQQAPSCPEFAKSSSNEEFEMKYDSNVFAIKSVLNELATGEKLDLQKINSISDSLYSEISNTDFIINHLGKMKAFDEYTYTHCINVALYSMLTAKWLKLPPKEIKDVIHAGLLHDIGKSKIPLEILNKPSRLTTEEFDMMKRHTVYGYQMAKSIDNIDEEVRKAILMHHERKDKTGYPIGLNGDTINMYTKIVAVTDVYDAMTSDRVYKKRSTPFEAFQMFKSSGLSSFDTKISFTFLTSLSSNYIGSKVSLSSGETGEICYIPPHNITKPVIALKSKYLDMSKEDFLKIESIVG